MNSRRFLFVLLLLITCAKSYSQVEVDDLFFRSFYHENGLQNYDINEIVQDHFGFIWMAGENGLLRFDGNQIKAYHENNQDSTSISSNSTNSLAVDHNGGVWVGTFMGFDRYILENDAFEPIAIFGEKDQRIYKSVHAICEGADGNIYAGMTSFGLVRYSPETGDYCVYAKSEESDGYNFVDYEIQTFYRTDKGIYIGSLGGGLNFFDLKTQQIEHLNPVDPTIKRALRNINSIDSDTEGVLWISTSTDGVIKYSIVEKSFDIFRLTDYGFPESANSVYATLDWGTKLWIGTNGNGILIADKSFNRIDKISSSQYENGLSNSYLREIYKDRSENVWVCFFKEGTNLLSSNQYPFKFISHEKGNKNSLSGNVVTSIIKDHNGYLWIGTDGRGLNKIDLKNGTFDFYNNLNSTGKGIQDNVILSLFEDKKHDIWVGTYSKGLYRYSPDKDNWTNYQYQENVPGSIHGNDVTCIIEDENYLWVATNGGGLNFYDYKTDDFNHYDKTDTLNGTVIANDWLTTLYKDSKGRIWYGSYWGLGYLDVENKQFVNYVEDQRNPDSTMSDKTVYCIRETPDHKIWVGTRNGLTQLDPETGNTHFYTVEDGLAANQILGMEIDVDGNLWISTDNGLSRMESVTHRITNFYKSDGLNNQEFFRQAAYQDKDGILYFGGSQGLSYFDPKKIRLNKSFPSVAISRFLIYNEEVVTGKKFQGNQILEKPIYLQDKIVLNYRVKSFTFEISAFEFSFPEKIKYAVKLEGFDESWRTSDFRHRFVSYTNLSPGTYTLKYKASNLLGEWPESEHELILVIKPPFWLTWWAYVIYFFLFMLILFLGWRISMIRVNARNNLEIERLKREQDEKLNQAKLQFFTNISHEFKTPVSLILIPLEKLLQRRFIKPEIVAELNSIKNNSNRLLRLVNQLLDFRKTELNKMKIQVAKSDIIPLLEEIFESFTEFATQKNIQFTFDSFAASHIQWVDSDKLDKIIYNLLSNAFKYTDSGGSVKLAISLSDDMNDLIIEVADTGKGISKDKLDIIFDRFYQDSNSWEGTGIGLALAKGLAVLHHGKIEVESELNKGSVFRLVIPYTEQAYEQDEKIDEVLFKSNYEDILTEEIEGEKESGDEKTEMSLDGQKLKLLIVEDNQELREYLVKEFLPFYQLLSAENGAIAWGMVLKEQPDLVISDVMMPEMDGISLCKKMKTDLRFSHIPIILLTAKSTVEHQIEGMDSGADLYIAKPFYVRHLISGIRQLLANREKMRRKYNDGISFVAKSITTSSPDEIFLNKAVELVKANMDSEHFDVSILSQEIGISRGHLHRKLRALTGESPSEFIRNIRLKQAAYMLINTHFNISEIASEVGFNSLSYFTNSFRKKFRMSPSDYQKQNVKVR